jgi:hypothetical protein
MYFTQGLGLNFSATNYQVTLFSFAVVKAVRVLAEFSSALLEVDVVAWIADFSKLFRA